MTSRISLRERAGREEYPVHYRTFNNYLRERYGRKVWKIPVDAGFTCPNRDGTAGTGGCIYCDVDSFVHIEGHSISEQVRLRAEKLRKRGITDFIIYLQSYSNTHGPLEKLQHAVRDAMAVDGIRAVYIGTRPDTVDPEKIAWLATLRDEAGVDVVMEYGLQSASDDTLALVNRGHGVEEFITAVELTHALGIPVCAHVILGLPGETEANMAASVDLVAKLGIEMIKFHHLHVVRSTALESIYMNGGVEVMDEDTYIALLARMISRLPENVVIARLKGDAPERSLVAPHWPSDKGAFEKKLIDYLERHGIIQGVRA